uniref:Uncharacterized protein n=1 Tax=Anguilla anguilla TaxID=7936 RepID=A0A0E9S675_ANGAN
MHKILKLFLVPTSGAKLHFLTYARRNRSLSGLGPIPFRAS